MTDPKIDRNYNIIVADDDDDDQYLIRQALRETLASHSVKAVSNGLELVDLLFPKAEKPAEPSLPDFILLDLNMPLLDGYGVLEKVRGSESTRAIPVFVLTTSRFEHDRRRSAELGATGFYSKPYQYDELKAIIRNICTEGIRA
jgi:CheY-like chemotaxis protein